MSKQFTVNYLTIKVLNNFIGHNLFQTLENHTFEQSAFDNHIVYLIRSICQKYIKIRLHLITQQKLSICR